MDKKDLSERDICTKFITPAVKRAGWDEMTQIREEVSFTKGRIILRGKLVTRGKAKRADYILYYKPNIPLALIEAKDNNHSVGAGMQQALGYAETLAIPFVFSSNGDAFVFHDRTGLSSQVETDLGLNDFPPPLELWARHRTWKGLATEQEAIVLQEDGAWREIMEYFCRGHPDRPDRHAKGDEVRLEHALLRRTRVLLLVEARHPRRVPGSLQSDQGPRRPGHRGLSAGEGPGRPRRQPGSGPYLQPQGFRPDAGAGRAHRAGRTAGHRTPSQGLRSRQCRGRRIGEQANAM